MLINILENITNKDFLLFILIIFLIFSSMLMVYLVYSQNKQLTKELIKDKKDNNKEIQELKELSKTLENLPKNDNIELTDYEMEQEEKAIISYDELLNTRNNVSINYLDSKVEDDVLVKQVDLENTGKIELDPIKQELNTKVTLVSYEHEEEFLKALKNLQYLLNE